MTQSRYGILNSQRIRFSGVFSHVAFRHLIPRRGSNDIYVGTKALLTIHTQVFLQILHASIHWRIQSLLTLRTRLGSVTLQEAHLRLLQVATESSEPPKATVVIAASPQLVPPSPASSLPQSADDNWHRSYDCQLLALHDCGSSYCDFWTLSDDNFPR